jgi:hypothetical protein
MIWAREAGGTRAGGDRSSHGGFIPGSGGQGSKKNAGSSVEYVNWWEGKFVQKSVGPQEILFSLLLGTSKNTRALHWVTINNTMLIELEPTCYFFHFF